MIKAGLVRRTTKPRARLRVAQFATHLQGEVETLKAETEVINRARFADEPADASEGTAAYTRATAADTRVRAPVADTLT